MQWRRRLLLVAYALVVLTFFEGACRVLAANPSFLRRISCNDDPSWRLQWLQRHRGSLDSPIFYAFDLFHPNRGWVLAPDLRDVRAMPVNREATLNTNSRGLRGKAEVPYERVPGRRRVLVLGDSFTFGEDVSDDETYPASLARLLPQCEVLNMGVHGYGYDQMLLALSEEGVRYRPDVVVVGFVYDDMDRVLLSFRDYAKPRFTVRDGPLRVTNIPLPSPQAFLARSYRESRLVDLIDILGDHLQDGARREQEARELSAALLDAMAKTARSVGAEPVLAYLPTELELLDRRPVPNEREQVALAMADRCGMRAIFLRSEFVAARAAGQPIQWHGHYSPAENQIVAKGLANALVP